MGDKRQITHYVGDACAGGHTANEIVAMEIEQRRRDMELLHAAAAPKGYSLEAEVDSLKARLEEQEREFADERRHNTALARKLEEQERIAARLVVAGNDVAAALIIALQCSTASTSLKASSPSIGKWIEVLRAWEARADG